MPEALAPLVVLALALASFHAPPGGSAGHAWVVGTSAPLPGELLRIPEIGVSLVLADEAPAGASISFAHPLEATRPAGLDDPLAPQQYAIGQLDLAPAWDLTSGAGATLAILDSGLASHEDLRDARIHPLAVARYDGSQGDACGHGTEVSGVAVAGLRNGLGISGAAPETTLIPVRVLGDDGGCGGNTFDLAAGIVLAANEGARVISMSLTAGAPGAAEPPEVRLAIAYAAQRGALLVAAAGNDPAGLAPPASDPNVVSVGCVTSRGFLCGFSPQGADLLASGEDVLTTTKDGGYAMVSGTSLSAPYVSAVAALVVAKDPALSAAQVRAILEQTAAGRVVDAGRAVALAGPG